MGYSDIFSIYSRLVLVLAISPTRAVLQGRWPRVLGGLATTLGRPEDQIVAGLKGSATGQWWMVMVPVVAVDN